MSCVAYSCSLMTYAVVRYHLLPNIAYSCCMMAPDVLCCLQLQPDNLRCYLIYSVAYRCSLITFAVVCYYLLTYVVHSC